MTAFNDSRIPAAGDRTIPAFSIAGLAHETWNSPDVTGDVALTVGVLAQISARPSAEDVGAFLGRIHPRSWKAFEDGRGYSVIDAAGAGLVIVLGSQGLVIATPFESALIRGSRWAVSVLTDTGAATLN